MPAARLALVTAAPAKVVSVIVELLTPVVVNCTGNASLAAGAAVVIFTAINPEKLGYLIGDGLNEYTTFVVVVDTLDDSVQGIPLILTRCNNVLVLVILKPSFKPKYFLGCSYTVHRENLRISRRKRCYIGHRKG